VTGRGSWTGESGGIHDLQRLADQVRRDYFPDLAPLSVRWGHQIDRRKRRSIRLGSYNHRSTEIRIHPRLDRAEVPGFFVQSIIHHEYLHHVVGARHNRRFHQLERRFRFQKEARIWLKVNLGRLLGLPKTRGAASPPVPGSQRPIQLPLF